MQLLKTCYQKQPAQILVVTLLILMLVSMTAIVVTSTVAKNNRQVFNNLEYEMAYNAAEGKLIEIADELADPSFELFDLQSTVIQDQFEVDDCQQITSEKYYCTHLGEGRKTVITVEETNRVNAYDLSAGEYFDIVLFESEEDIGYDRSIGIRWVGSSAVELTLMFMDSQGRMRSSVEVVEPFSGEDIFTDSGRPSSGFLNSRVTFPAGEDELTINLQDLDRSKVPSGSKLRYLRVKAISNKSGLVLNVRPVEDDDLPNQVRKIEAFNYSLNELESAAPVVVTQLPLSPPTLSPLSYAANFGSVKTPICGNGIVEGDEECDDGDQNNNNGCDNCCGRTYDPVITGLNTRWGICSAGRNTPVVDDALPFRIEVPRSAEYFEVPTATGLIQAYPGLPATWPLDGNPNHVSLPISCSNVNAAISPGISRDLAVAGVFLASHNPPTGAVPQALPQASTQTAVVRPQLKQGFFIGDGRVGQATQRFYIPEGAAFLYIGFYDSGGFTNPIPGFYSDNQVTDSNIRIKFMNSATCN